MCMWGGGWGVAGRRKQKLLNRLSSHKRKCIKNHKIKDIRDKRINHQGKSFRAGEQDKKGGLGGSGMESGALIPGAFEPMSTVYLSRFCTQSEESSRIDLRTSELCESSFCLSLLVLPVPAPIFKRGDQWGKEEGAGHSEASPTWESH